MIARGTGLLQAAAQISGGFVPYLIGWLIAVTNGSYTAGFVFLILTSLLCAFTYIVLYLREGRSFGIVEPLATGH
jgi:nitrate/nitrite transporter NarK